MHLAFKTRSVQSELITFLTCVAEIDVAIGTSLTVLDLTSGAGAVCLQEVLVFANFAYLIIIIAL